MNTAAHSSRGQQIQIGRAQWQVDDAVSSVLLPADEWRHSCAAVGCHVVNVDDPTHEHLQEVDSIHLAKVFGRIAGTVAGIAKRRPWKRVKQAFI
jgi:hypothetical protein